MNYRDRLSDKHWVRVLPSEANKMLKVPPPVNRGSVLIDRNSAHLVGPVPKAIQHASGICHIYLCGTGCTPTENGTSSWFLSSSWEQQIPTIALSYCWGNISDSERNATCASKGGQERIENYHRDVLFGGNTSGLIDVTVCNSVCERLKSLLLHLTRTRDPSEGWSHFLNLSTDEAGDIINWDKFIFSGHSQGSGHVCYLAKYKRLAAAVFISGPQELVVLDSSEPTWMQKEDGAFATKEMFAFAHENEELTSALIRQNWQVISPLRYNSSTGSSTFRAPISPGNSRTFSTNIIPDPACGSFGGRPNHNSTVGDANTPRDAATDVPLYFSLWTSIFSQILVHQGSSNL